MPKQRHLRKSRKDGLVVKCASPTRLLVASKILPFEIRYLNFHPDMLGISHAPQTEISWDISNLVIGHVTPSLSATSSRPCQACTRSRDRRTGRGRAGRTPHAGVQGGPHTPRALVTVCTLRHRGTRTRVEAWWRKRDRDHLQLSVKRTPWTSEWTLDNFLPRPRVWNPADQQQSPLSHLVVSQPPTPMPRPHLGLGPVFPQATQEVPAPLRSETLRSSRAGTTASVSGWGAVPLLCSWYTHQNRKNGGSSQKRKGRKIPCAKEQWICRLENLYRTRKYILK